MLTLSGKRIMAGGFEIQCPNCDHKWGGVNHTIRIEPPFLGDTVERHSLICPACFTGASYPKRIEPIHWMRYVSNLPENFCDGGFVRRVCNAINESLNGRTGYCLFTTPVIDIQCPDYNSNMIEGDIECVELRCPNCREAGARFNGFNSLVSVLRPG